MRVRHESVPDVRVAMVSEHASPLAAIGGVDGGGQNVHVAALATHLAQRGARVTVHTRRESPDLPRRVPMGAQVTVDHITAGPSVPVPKDHLPAHMDVFADELAKAWEASPPDVVHAHFWMSGKAALDAARPLGIPVVQTFHALGVVKRRHLGRLDTSPGQRLVEEHGVVVAADHIIATCTDEMFELVRLGADPARISVVPCGVDLRLFAPDGPAVPRRPGWHRLVYVGRLVPRKGVDTIISALPRLPDTELVVAGGPPPSRLASDPEVGRLMELATNHQVLDRISFLGGVSRQELPAMVRSADVVVSVPRYEPFGIVPLEAMACGVPVVVSSVGGLVDSVVDGLTGLHVRPGDPVELCRVLRSLLSDPARRGQLGQAGLARARRLYGWPRVADATLRVYAGLVSAAEQTSAGRPAPVAGGASGGGPAAGDGRASSAELVKEGLR